MFSLVCLWQTCQPNFVRWRRLAFGAEFSNKYWLKTSCFKPKWQTRHTFLGLAAWDFLGGVVSTKLHVFQWFCLWRLTFFFLNTIGEKSGWNLDHKMADSNQTSRLPSLFFSWMAMRLFCGSANDRLISFHVAKWSRLQGLIFICFIYF